MSTTTIRLPEDLKARIARAATAAGTTAHAFILDAIVEKAALAEQQAGFQALADQRYARFLESGDSIPWEEARAYLKERWAGKNTQRPAPDKQDR